MITEKTQIDFCNVCVRTIADKAIQIYKTKKVVLAKYVAISKVYPFPDDATVIDDGADVDRRLPLCSSQVCASMAQIAADVADMEANDYEKFNMFMAIAVNTGA